MRNRIAKNLFYISCVFVLCSLNINSAEARVIDPKSDAWKEIINLYNKGYDIIERQPENWDDQNLWRQREAIFTEAAAKLTQYIEKYHSSPDNVTYLRLQYRLGNFWEISQNFKSAQQAYLICQNHPLIKDSEAVFDGKSLETLVKERLSEVKLNMKKQYTRTPGYIYIHRGGGWAIFEERDFESLPPRTIDLLPESKLKPNVKEQKLRFKKSYYKEFKK
jgi:hypothetical protein